MALGHTDQLLILACDHRGSFQKKLLGIEGTPSPEEEARIRDAKRVIFDGFRRAHSANGAEGMGILIDEQFGADPAREARDLGVVLAMPVEKSGQNEFDFEYGDRFGEHILEFDPSFSKVLVRYNAEGDAEMNRRQAERLARLSSWLRDNDRKFLFELLVPAEPGQLERVGGDTDRYDRELRPDLMIAAIGELQTAGVEPDVWKIEGLTSATIAFGSPRRSGPAAATRSAASSSGGVATKRRSWNGSARAPAFPATSASPSAGRSGGTRSRRGSRAGRPTKPPRRSPRTTGG